MRSNCMVVLSGGQDSTTCLFWAKRHYDDVHAVTFDYGQRHRIEIDAARKIAEMAQVASHEVISLGDGILKSTSPLVSDNELEQYPDPDSLPGGLEKTFVPMRNALFLTVAANRAYMIPTSVLVTGVSQEDYGGYPDCRGDFLSYFQHMATEGAFTNKDGAPKELILQAPLLYETKARSVHMALGLLGCYEALAFSHTGYDGAYPPMGSDHATLLRAKGFRDAGVPDPLLLRAFLEGALSASQLPETPNYDPDNVGEYIVRIEKVL